MQIDGDIFNVLFLDTLWWKQANEYINSERCVEEPYLSISPMVNIRPDIMLQPLLLWLEGLEHCVSSDNYYKRKIQRCLSNKSLGVSCAFSTKESGTIWCICHQLCICRPQCIDNVNLCSQLLYDCIINLNVTTKSLWSSSIMQLGEGIFRKCKSDTSFKSIINHFFQVLVLGWPQTFCQSHE